MEGDLVLAGLRPRTIQAYLDAVAGLAHHYGRSPERINQTEVRQYLLYLTEERRLAPNTMRPVVAGLKFFYSHTLPRDWKTLHSIRIPKTQSLPVVLIPDQVWALIEATEALHFRTFFRVAYTCGLRPGDARHLEVGDIDGPRRILHIRHTKGGNQRCVPMPQATLEALREYWATHRHPKWLFPSRAALQWIAQAPGPMSERGVQRAFQKVVQHLGLKRKGLCPHTLRHSYATTM